MIEEAWVTARLAERVNANERLVSRGRHLDVGFLLEMGERQFLVEIRRGAIASASRIGRVMPAWRFALRADEEAWAEFCRPLPPPGFHDLMALAKFRRMRLEGDLHPLMSHLLYFKDVLACLRSTGGQP